MPASETVKRYSYQPINGSGGLGEHHYRITDAGDNRIATCYLEGNARFIVDELNRLAAAEARCRALEECVREWGGSMKTVKVRLDTLQALLLAGQQMSNLCYNWSQCDEFTKRERESMGEMTRHWDAHSRSIYESLPSERSKHHDQ